MFKLKLVNKPVLLKLKCNFSFPPIVLANMQEKEVVPTKKVQEILPDKNFDGLSKVIVNKIPDEYIIPDGDLEINHNGTFDVADKANAIVNVPEKKLGTKTITINGIYKATDDNLDGYSEVEVETSGVDINDYFNNELYNPTSSTTNCGVWINSIKQLPQNINLNESVTSCSYFFAGYPSKILDLSNFDTKNVKTMNSMFRTCPYLTTLDLSNFNTSNVTTMDSMFYTCNNLATLNLSSFNTLNVTSMKYMFWECNKLTDLDVSSFDTSKVTSMVGMFRNCRSLTTLDLSNFDTSNVTEMDSMFIYCSTLTNLDLSSFNTSKVTGMYQMFSGCSKLKNLNISNFDFTNVTSYTSMFQNVPTDCYILCKDATAKEWITSKFTTLTNVHYVGEEG